MKKTLKKLLVCILIVLMINNLFFNNISLADDGGFEEWLADMMGTVVGLLTWPIRMIALACAWAIDGVTRNVALSQGAVDEMGNIVEGTYYNIEMLTPFDIFFNRVAILDVNFFNVDTSNDIITTMRNSIAGWYYVMRMIAAAILLCILIYVGIRMAITTIASDKAAYKKMLVDWICSLALIFLLQYIMLFTFAVNEAFIKGLSGVADAQSLCDAMVNIKKLSTGISINSIAATIVFCMLTIQTIGLLISYINRMLKIAFLVIIAPLITLTYSMDKMGDGKAQALTTWLKEFIYTVLLQTFHCIIYLAFVGMALSILSPDGGATSSDDNNLAGVVLAILCIKFTKDAEKILGKIFDFSGSTSDSSLAVGMAASAMALGKAKDLGRGARNAVNGVRNLNIGGRLQTARIEGLAMASFLKGKTNENGEKMSWAEAKDDAATQITEKKAEKAEKKNSKKYNVSKNQKYNDEVKAVADDLMKNTGMTAKLATATARAQVAKSKRREAKDSKHPNLAKARGTVSKLNQARKLAMNSETGKAIRGIINSQVAAGIGTFAGAGTYGASGNLFNAFALGAASYKGTQEFFKNSSDTLVDTSQKLLQGFGVTNSAQAENELKTTRAMAPILSDNSEVQRQLDDLVKFVEDALGKGDGAKDAARDAKTTIKNTVAKGIKEDPSISNEALMGKVMEALGKRNALKGDQVDDKGNKTGSTWLEALTATDSLQATLQAGVNDVSDLQRRKELFDVIQGAGNIGLTEDAISRMAAREFPVSSAGTGDAFVSNEELIRRIESEGYVVTEADKDQRTLDGNVEMSEALQDKFDESVASVNQETMSAQEVQAAVEQQKALAENIRNINDTVLPQITDEYMKQYEALAKKLETEAQEKVRTQLEREIDKLRTKFESELKDYQKNNACILSNRDEANGEKAQIVERVSKEVLDEAMAKFATIPTYKKK